MVLLHMKYSLFGIGEHVFGSAEYIYDVAEYIFGDAEQRFLTEDRKNVNVYDGEYLLM